MPLFIHDLKPVFFVKPLRWYVPNIDIDLGAGETLGFYPVRESSQEVRW